MIALKLNRRLSPVSALAALLTGCLVIAGVEMQAIRAHEAPKLGPHKMDAAYCVSCHRDQKTIQTMRMKEDGANFLFNPDGTFKDPKFASLNTSYHHGNPGAPPK
jgi:hypothetical protein